MNIALILSTFVISAATMASPSDNPAMSQIVPPTSALPLPPVEEKMQTQGNRSSLKDAQKRNAQKSQPRTTARTGSYSGRTQQSNGQDRKPMMPIAPTDSASGNQQVGQDYQWLPPTANPATGAGDTSGGRPSGMFGPMNVPTSPTRARPGTPDSYSSMQTVKQQNQRLGAARSAATSGAQVSPKPYSGYSQSTATSSPYMNLFRTGSNNGTVDNYSTLVKPELEQRRANQKFGSDIHGLENSTHVQGLSIQQLNRETQSLQGVNATQYFMNYGDYYSGAK
jgi:hypothetical protein